MPDIIFKIGPEVPGISYEKFAKEAGVSVRWVKEQVAQGNIPIMPKQGKQKPLVNVAKYWQTALSLTY